MSLATDATAQVTRILKDWSAGDRSALDCLTPIVYAELHRIAERKLVRERNHDLLQPSALVNEAFLRLITSARVNGRIGPISLRTPPTLCATSWWTSPASAGCRVRIFPA